MGRFGHEFLEFEFRPDGKLRYANNSNYKNDSMIRKEVYMSPSLMKELRRVIDESEVMKYVATLCIWRGLLLLLLFLLKGLSKARREDRKK